MALSFFVMALIFVCCLATLVLIGFRTAFGSLKHLVGLAVAAILIAVAGSLLFALQHIVVEENAAEARSLEARFTAVGVLSTVLDAEAGQRGFLLTGDVKYLSSFTAANARIGGDIAKLRLDANRDEAEVAIVSRLVDRIEAKFAEMRSTLVEKDAGGRDAALAIVQTDQGLRLMSEIKTLSESLENHEAGLIDPIRRKRDRNQAIIGLGIAALLILAVVTVLVTAYLSAKGAAQRRRVMVDLAERNSLLSLAGELANIGYWRIAVPSMVVTWSDEIFRIHGRDPSLGVPALADAIDAYAPEDRARVARIVAEAVKTGTGFEFEARLLVPNGRDVDVISRGVCGTDPTGAVSSLFGIFHDVTPIRKTERDLKKSEHFLQAVLDGSPDPMMVFEADGQFSFLNNKAVEMITVCRRDADEDVDVHGRPRFQALWPPSRRGDVAQSIAAANAGHPASFQARLFDDGTGVRQFSVALRNLDKSGRLVATARDVTETHAVLKRKERMERQFRLLADHSYDVIMVRNAVPFSPRKYASPACRDVLGFEPAELCAMSFAETIHPDDIDRVERLYQSLGPAQRSERTVHRVIHKVHGWVWVEVVLRHVAMFDDGIEIGPVIVGSLRDITERRAIEDTLARSQELYQLFAQNVSDVIVKVDERGLASYVSPTSSRLLGREPADLVGVDVLHLVHPDDRQPIETFLTSEATDPSVRGRAEYRVLHASGDWVWIESEAFALSAVAGGGPAGFIAVLRDFQERHDAQENLKAALESAELARRQAEAANAAKTDFLAAMSHEIRTPLNSIIGFTALMLDDRALTGDLRRRADLIASSGSALLTVINDILDFSKIEAGAIDIVDAPFAPRALLSNALAIVRDIAAAKRIALSISIDPKLAQGLMGDQARIQQILLNLLNNAIKFTKAGSVALNVSIERSRDQFDTVRFAVVDTGIGISPRRQDRLFKRFSQGDSSITREFGGTGLGLAICKRLVEAMHGDIGVVSEEGHGATFWFTLTLRQVAIDRHDADGERAQLSRLKGRLLLVEDIEVNQLLAKTLLEIDGHLVDVVASGEEAVIAVQAKPYDLVLMDIQMPGIGGVAATQAIRRLGVVSPDLPIIAMTANVLSDQIKAFKAVGMNDHIGKPIDRADLRSKLETWLAAKAAPANRVAEGDPARFDKATYDEIAILLGPTKLDDMLRKFQIELETRLLPVDSEPRDRVTFERDAHVVTSIAGLVGFVGLAAQCADVLASKGSDPVAFKRKSKAILREKTWVAERIAHLLKADDLSSPDLASQDLTAKDLAGSMPGTTRSIH